MGQAIPGNVSFWEDNEICFVRGGFTNETDGFGNGCFCIEEDWGDVASYTSINTSILLCAALSCRQDPPATLTLGSHDFAMII
jgi:hypothetical protein